MQHSLFDLCELLLLKLSSPHIYHFIIKKNRIYVATRVQIITTEPRIDRKSCVVVVVVVVRRGRRRRRRRRQFLLL